MTNRLENGTSLSANGTLTSPNGLYNLVYGPDGNLTLRCGDAVVWQTGIIGNPGKLIVQSGDGHVVLYDAANQPRWYTGIYGNAYLGDALELHDNGQLAVVMPNGTVVWTTPMPNQIVLENTKPGTTNWMLDNPVPFTQRDSNTYRMKAIEGYASLTSVNIGQTIKFYVSTTAPTFDIEIYRLGWYNNNGGRFVQAYRSILGCDQNMPVSQKPSTPDYGLLECNWIESLEINIPSDWTSGIYLAKLKANTADSKLAYQSYIVFVVRNDVVASIYLMQCSVATYQAYNGWGGRSIYGYNCYPKQGANGITTKVSFNRPYFAGHNGFSENGEIATSPNTTGSGHVLAHFPGGDPAPGWEYNMLRWLERYGYDVTYCTNIDVHGDRQRLLSHRGFLVVGHDEYWTREMRCNVELARDQGVDIMFFCGNSVFMQSRLENDRQGNPFRTLVSFKEDRYTDPVATRIAAYKPAADYINPFPPLSQSFDDLYPYPNVSTQFNSTTWPETSLTGSTWLGSKEEDFEITSPDDWIFAGSGAIANQKMTGMAGYEIDGDIVYSNYAPPNRRILARSPNAALIQAYAVEGGASVFSSGSIQWSWGLDDFVIPGIPENYKRPSASTPNLVVQQMTKNLLARAARITGANSTLYRTDGNGVITPFAQEDGWRLKWRIVPGSFNRQYPHGALFYDATTGQGQFYGVDSNGKWIHVGSQNEGWRKTWRIIPGKFSNSGLTDLLFFDRAYGQAQFYQTDGNGGLLIFGSQIEGLRQTSQIITGHFRTDSPFTDLLFYDPAHGDIQFFATDGNGRLTPIGGLTTGWPKTLQIIPGVFRDGGSTTDLLFFDPALGQGTFYRTDGNGGILPFGGTVEILSTWKIVAGKFRDSNRTDLLLYNPTSGAGQFYGVDGSGGIQGFGNPLAGLRFQIIPGAFSNGKYTDLLRYDPFAKAP